MRDPEKYAEYNKAWRAQHPEYWKARYAANREAHKANGKAWRESDPTQYGFRTQRGNARRRGIAFLLTFKEWLDWWGEDLGRRGRKANDLVMARIRDQGPYALGNIEKITFSQNAIDSNRRKSK